MQKIKQKYLMYCPFDFREKKNSFWIKYFTKGKMENIILHNTMKTRSNYLVHCLVYLQLGNIQNLLYKTLKCDN